MKKLFIIAVIACAALLTSCSTHFYSSSNASVAKTEVLLSQKNFKVIGQAEGVATITQVLGIGGCSQKQVRSNAVAEMFKPMPVTAPWSWQGISEPVQYADGKNPPRWNLPGSGMPHTGHFPGTPSKWCLPWDSAQPHRTW